MASMCRVLLSFDTELVLAGVPLSASHPLISLPCKHSCEPEQSRLVHVTGSASQPIKAARDA